MPTLQVSNSVVHDPSGSGVPSTSFFNFNQQNSPAPAPAGVGQAPVRAPPLTPGSTQFSAQPFQSFNGLPPQPRFQSREAKQWFRRPSCQSPTCRAAKS